MTSNVTLNKPDQGVVSAETLAMLALCVVVYAYISNAFTGQNLHVWGDEITYSIESRQLDFKNSTYPVFLYLGLFHFAHIAHQGFLELARSMNAALLALSVPFIYFTAAAFTTRKRSLLISAVTVLGPITTYGAYFMPDAMYFTVFWIFAWFVLTRSKISPVAYGAGVGLLAGLSAMVKPHATFLLLGFIAAQIVLTICTQTKPAFRRNAISSGISLVAFAIARIGCGWYFGGEKGLSLFGAYTDYANVKWNTEKLTEAAHLCGILLRGHFVGLVLLSGPAILALSIPLRCDVDRREDLIRFRTFAVCTITVMFFISVLFSVRIADGAPFVDTMRVHMRYYNLFFPLLYISVAVFADAKYQVPRIVWPISAVLMFAVLSIGFGSLDRFAFLQLDSPELRGLVANRTLLNFSWIFSLLSIALFTYRQSLGAKIYLLLALPIMALLGSYFVNNDLKVRFVDLPGDVAGKVVRIQLAEDSSHIGFFGDVVSIYQAMFYAGDRRSFTYKLADGEPVPAILKPGLPVPGQLLPPGQLMPSGTRWIVVFGKRPVPDNYELFFKSSEWALFRVLK